MRSAIVTALAALTLVIAPAAGAAPPDDGGEDGDVERYVLRGDGMVVHVEDRGGRQTGTIRLGGKTYPFTSAADEADDVVSGTYRAGGKSVPFTVRLEDEDTGRAVLETQGRKYRLTEDDDEGGAEPPRPPAPRGDDRENPPGPPIRDPGHDRLPDRLVPPPDDEGADPRPPAADEPETTDEPVAGDEPPAGAEGDPGDAPADRAVLMQAARKGDTDAMYALGGMAEHGKGGPVNLREAAKWYEKAGAAEHMDAMAALAILHLRGEGVAHDPARARELLEYAAEGGSRLAKRTIADLEAGKDFRRKRRNPLAADRPRPADPPPPAEEDPDVAPDPQIEADDAPPADPPAEEGDAPPPPADPAARPRQGQGQGRRPGAGGGVPQTLVLEKRTLRDKTTRLDVSTLLVPKGWTFNEQIIWRADRAQFVTNASELIDPRSGMAVRWLPIDQFSANPDILNAARQQGLPPIGSGGVELTDRPLDPEGYLRQVALPRYRQIEGARVVNAEELPDVARATAQMMKWQIDTARQAGIEYRLTAGRVRIEYPGPDRTPIEEDVYCTLVTTWQPGMNQMARQLGTSESFSFYPQVIYALAAPKGRLDAVTPLLQTIVASERATAKWSEYVTRIQQMRQRIAINEQVLAAEARREISEVQRRTHEERMAARDRISEQVGDNLAGVQRFVEPSDPNTRVTLPQSYNQAWSDGQGRYIVSNDVNYDPRQDRNLNGDWQEMQRPAR